MKNELSTGYAAYILRSIEQGYFWECACGERFRSREAACRCGKCWEYLADPVNREAPVDLRTLVG